MKPIALSETCRAGGIGVEGDVSAEASSRAEMQRAFVATLKAAALRWRDRPALVAGAVFRVEEVGLVKKLLALIVLGSTLLCLGAVDANAQREHPIIDRLAERVIQKYQASSCATLAHKRHQPKSRREERALRMMRDLPRMRRAFIDKVAGPIANKLFDCGLIP
jgi:hypothetical protein